jgi:hypothetical protein
MASSAQAASWLLVLAGDSILNVEGQPAIGIALQVAEASSS